MNRIIPSKIKHLIIFVHGLTNRCTRYDLCHGLSLLRVHKFPQNKIHFSTANTGNTGHETFIKTSQGIEIAGHRLVQELETTLKNNLNVTHLSFIGASLGGLFARYAIAQLFNTKKSIIKERNIIPHAFITLATPHLGSYNLRKTSTLISTKCSEELQLSDNILENLAVSSSTVLNKFTHRVAYAPLINDGIVPWCTSALSLTRDSHSISSSCPIIREYKLMETSDKCDYIVETDVNYSRVIRMAKLLREFPWIIVDVNMPHKHLATLYETGPQGPHCLEVASHVMKWLNPKY